MRIWFIVIPLLFATTVSASAETLFKEQHGSIVHYGTTMDPRKCCDCRPVVSKKLTDAGIEYTDDQGRSAVIPSNHHYQNGSDGEMWLCPAVGIYQDLYLPPCLIIPHGDVTVTQLNQADAQVASFWYTAIHNQ